MKPKGLYRWKSTRNHWAYKLKAERQEILKGISKGWGRKPITRITLICEQCGKKYEVKKSHKNRSKYCSRECFNKSKKGKIPKNIKIAQVNSPFQKGEQNLNWKGGITPYPKEWTGSLHHKVWIRDQNKCQLCGKVGVKRTDLIVHHKDFTKKNCKIDNLILLCRSCHMKIHWQENKGVPGLKNYKRDSS